MTVTTMQLTGPQRAAVVLLQLGQDRASKVLAQMSETEVEEISAEIVRMDSVPAKMADDVIQDFHAQVLGGSTIVGHGGLAAAQKLLEASFGAERAQGLLDRLASMLQGQPFDFLQSADSRQVMSLLTGEHPQTIALVLAHLRPERAAGIIASLEPKLRTDVAHRIATMEQTSPEVVAIVADNIERKASSVLSQSEALAVGGVQPLVDILNRADPGTEKQILDTLADKDKGLSDEVRALMFTFEDIILLDDRAVQLVLRSVDTNGLAIALKGAASKVAEKIMKNLSERARENLVDEMDASGPVRMSQVQEARGAIVTTIRSLEDSGQIVINRDGEDEFVS